MSVSIAFVASYGTLGSLSCPLHIQEKPSVALLRADERNVFDGGGLSGW